MLFKKKVLFSLVALLAFVGCGKDINETSQEKTTWTINGVTYTEGTTTSYSSGNLSASDNSLNGDITIQFASKPTISGSFPITDFSDTAVLLNGTNCSIVVRIPPNNNYRSSGGAVSIDVGAGGKLTAIFSNITMKHTVTFTTKSLSGKMIED